VLKLKIRSRIFRFLTGYNPHYKFTAEDKQKADEIKALRSELRRTTQLMDMKMSMIELQKKIQGIDGSEADSPEAMFFKKAIDIMGNKLEQKMLANQLPNQMPGRDPNTFAPIPNGDPRKELSDQEFNKFAKEWIAQIPTKNLVALRNQEDQELLETVDVFVQDRAKILLSEDQLNKTVELIKNGC